jgi:hypothetical protein
MTTGGNHPVNSSSKSNHGSHNVVSRYHQTDPPSLNEQIRTRAFEIYVERGKQPGGGVADSRQAEREYHERS